MGDTLNTSPNNSYLAFLAMSEPITKGLNLDKIYIKLWYFVSFFKRNRNNDKNLRI